MQILSKKQEFILFALGRLYEELNKKLSDKYLKIAIPKYIFIEIIQKAKLTERKSRTIYKHLEALEKNKCISYENNSLALTKKGQKHYKKILKQHEPFILLNQALLQTSPQKFSRKSQTVFRFD